MDYQKLLPDYPEKLIYPVLLAITVSFILAFGHVRFGQQFYTMLGKEGFKLLDRYVFFLSLAIGALIPVGHYLRTGDETSSFAILAALTWSLFLGLEDIFVYLLHPDKLPATLPWLDNTVIGFTSQALGLGTVTGQFLVGFVVLTGVLLIYFIDFLYGFEKYGL